MASYTHVGLAISSHVMTAVVASKAATWGELLSFTVPVVTQFTFESPSFAPTFELAAGPERVNLSFRIAIPMFRFEVRFFAWTSVGMNAFLVRSVAPREVQEKMYESVPGKRERTL